MTSNRIIIGSINNCFDNASQCSRYSDECDGCWGSKHLYRIAGGGGEMTGQMGRTMIVIVLVVATLIASSGDGAAKRIDEISCTYSISPTSQSFGDIGGSGDVSVTSQGDCSWTATSNDDWITVISGDSGSGSGTVGYSVAANPDADSRTGTITIAGETFTVTQDGIDVEASVSSSGTPPSIDYQWALSVNDWQHHPR